MSNSKFRLDHKAVALLKECNELAWRLSGRVEDLVSDVHGTGVSSSTRRELVVLEEYLNKLIHQTTETLDADQSVDDECVYAVCPNPTKISGYGIKVDNLLPNNWEIVQIYPDEIYIRGHNQCVTDTQREFEHYVQPRLASGLIHSELLTAEETEDFVQDQRENLQDGWADANDERYALPY